MTIEFLRDHGVLLDDVVRRLRSAIRTADWDAAGGALVSLNGLNEGFGEQLSLDDFPDVFDPRTARVNEAT